MEALSHYDTEPAAKALASKDPLAAAKVYRALGLRILSAGKSRYYGAALDHFKKARNLYCRSRANPGMEGAGGICAEAPIHESGDSWRLSSRLPPASPSGPRRLPNKLRSNGNG